MRKVIIIHLWLIAGGLGFYALWSFMGANPEGFQLRFFNWRLMEISVGSLITLSFALGFLLSFALFVIYGSSLYLEIRKLRRENSSLQRTLDRQLHSSSSK